MACSLRSCDINQPLSQAVDTVPTQNMCSLSSIDQLQLLYLYITAPPCYFPSYRIPAIVITSGASCPSHCPLVALLCGPVTALLVLPSLCCRRLVLFMLARTWHTQAVPVSDLVFNGLAGLRLAAARFDPSKGTRFSTVASAWVGQHIARSR